jgi:SAM-dependent methyltransferase
MADQETIESYDQSAEDWAKRQRHGTNMAHQYLEKPAMYGKLPNLGGLSVLALGCGSGEECDYLKKRGAGRVVGVDMSRGLIEQAKYAFPDIEFEVMDIEKIKFPEQTFDYAYSSLAMHYAEDWRNVLKPLHRVLKPEGVFLFSTHHPVNWGAGGPKEAGAKTSLLGFERTEDDSYTIYGDYLNSRKINNNLTEKIKVSYYHKPLSEIIREILDSGFEIIDFLEPKALEGAKKERPEFYEVRQKIPLFMIFELRKK